MPEGDGPRRTVEDIIHDFEAGAQKAPDDEQEATEGAAEPDTDPEIPAVAKPRLRTQPTTLDGWDEQARKAMHQVFEHDKDKEGEEDPEK